MSIASRYHRAMSWLPPAALFALAGCGGDLTVPPATRPITQHIFTLSAMTGTAARDLRRRADTKARAVEPAGLGGCVVLESPVRRR